MSSKIATNGKLLKIIAVIAVVIVISTVIYVELPNLQPPAKPELKAYPGPAGLNSDHILGGCVLAVAHTHGLTAQEKYAEEQFMAYMLSPPVQFQCSAKTGFIPISSHNIANYAVPNIYHKGNATVTIDYFTSISPSDYTAFTKTAISNFEKAYPNIKINPSNTVATSIVSHVKADVAAKTTTPIVMTIDNLDIGELAYGGASYGGYLNNINGTISTITPSNTISSIVNLTHYESKIFSGNVPFITQIINTPLVWLNYNALKNAGITSLPKTYHQMLADAKILDKKYGVGMINIQGHGGASTATELYQMLTQFNGNPVLLNNTGDIQGMYCLYNLSKYFSPEYKTSYWATYKGLASNKYSVMDYQWPGSVNLTALGMKYNSSGNNSITNISIQALKGGVFIRDPVSWISEWQTLMDSAYETIIVSGHAQNYTTIHTTLNAVNSEMYGYLVKNYNTTVANNFEAGMYKPIMVN